MPAEDRAVDASDDVGGSGVGCVIMGRKRAADIEEAAGAEGYRASVEGHRKVRGIPLE